MVWPFLLYKSWLNASIAGKFQLAEFYRWELVTWLKPFLKNFGSKFQAQVWTAIGEISWGETLAYAELALKISRPKAFRAVANACGANPWPFIIPCHRIVASQFEPKTWKNLGGYGLGTDLKQALLKLELG